MELHTTHQNNNEYPTDEQLKIITEWDCINGDIPKLIAFIKELWWMPEWGFIYKKGRDHLTRKTVWKLELHTGGWSGNESIIGALQKNEFFWMRLWLRHDRGGHYYFQIEQNPSRTRT